MSPRFLLGRENVPCLAEVVNRSLKADCTDFIMELPHSDLGLSVCTHPFKNVFELFHVKTTLRELNIKQR